MGDDVTARLRLEPGDLRCRVTAGDPRPGPVGGRQRSGEGNLGSVVYRPRHRTVKRGPVLRPALVGNPAHDVGAGLPQPADRVFIPLLVIGQLLQDPVQRAHVLTHVAQAADARTRMLLAARAGRVGEQYPSEEARTEAIDA